MKPFVIPGSLGRICEFPMDIFSVPFYHAPAILCAIYFFACLNFKPFGTGRFSHLPWNPQCWYGVWTHSG